ncbi:transposase-like protein, partial [Olsenella profusa DSM 13989]|nr:transposase-like protein [Olsenella profusa DSM 13989]
MYGEEFKARALEVLEECSGSCIRAARKPGIVSSKALQRWKNDLAEPPRKEHR